MQTIYYIYFDLDATNAYHQRNLSKTTSELLSVPTVWALVRPLFMPEGRSPAQGILMTVMKKIFEDYEEWMIVKFDNMLILAHDYDNTYNKLKLVLDRAYKQGLV